jgi:hypothetical protein
VELTSSEVIEVLFVPEKGALMMVAPVAPAASGRKRQNSRCRCGQCRMCADNARWERVFQEKFADPDYYKPRSVGFGASSLGTFK